MLRQNDGQSVFQAPDIDPKFLDLLMGAIVDLNSGEVLGYCNLITYPEKKLWLKVGANEFERLMQDLKLGIVGTNTMRIIHRSQVPVEQNVTYACFCAITNLKSCSHNNAAFHLA